MPRGAPVTITADGVVGISGTPKMLYGLSLRSGGTASVIIVINGSAAGDTAVITFTGTASTGAMLGGIPAGGLYFPSGIFADVDANITNATFWIEEARNL